MLLDIYAKDTRDSGHTGGVKTFDYLFDGGEFNPIKIIESLLKKRRDF